MEITSTKIEIATMTWQMIGFLITLPFALWLIIAGSVFSYWESCVMTSTTLHSLVIGVFWPIWLIRELKRGFLEEWKK